jgi:histidinol dehydrogenase
VLEYTRRFDHLDAKAMVELELPKRELEAALFNLPAEQREALEQAATRIALYHQKQLPLPGSTPRPTARASARR